MIKVTQAKTVIHKHSKAFPVMQDVNPYRGCTIGCKYCFAQYSHYYIGLNNFFRDIIVKANVAPCLDYELYGGKRKGQIKVGGVTDVYQHIEKKYELMPEILSILHKYKTPLFLSTKSDLILRDFNLIKQLAEVTAVDIAVSISCFDEKNAKIFESGATAPSKRIEAIGKFTEFCRTVSVLNIPIIPYISDSYDELESLFALSKESNIDYMVSYPLHLRSFKVKNSIFQLVRRHFPETAQRFIALYKNSSSPSKEYTHELYAKINTLREKYDLYDNFSPYEGKTPSTQLSLF